MRALAALLGLALAGLPFLALPSRPAAVASAVVALVCAAAIVLRSERLATLGGRLALLEYAAALAIAGGPPDVAGATAVGVALLLWRLVVDFARRTSGAALGPGLLAAQARYWAGLGAASAALAVAVAGAAHLLARVVPLPARPALIAAGALVAFVGACGASGAGRPARAAGEPATDRGGVAP